MCKLFFSLNDESIHKHIIDFLAQTKCKKTEKNCTESNDGFGIAWVNQSHFELYKQPFSYDKDAHLNTIIPSISGKMVFGHIREKEYGKPSLENTHPFIFENQLFMHNGGIIHFHKHKHCIKQYIAEKYLKYIHGETDSEHMFFLLLSFMDYYKQTPVFTKKQIQLYENIPRKHCAMSMMFHFFEMNSITLNANIIYSNMHETIITKYATGKTKYCPLYLNTKNNGNDKSILITTKVLPEYKGVIIPDHSILHMNHDNGTMSISNENG